MGHAIRLRMANHDRKLSELVEADEGMVGGKPRKDPSNPDARKGKQGHTTKKPVIARTSRRPVGGPRRGFKQALGTSRGGRTKKLHAVTYE